MKLISARPPSYRGSASLRCTATRSACRCTHASGKRRSVNERWIRAAPVVRKPVERPRRLCNALTVVEIPAAVRAKALAAGVTEWLAALPTLIAQLEQDWSITVGRGYEDPTEAFVAEATTGEGLPVVLKLVVPRAGNPASHEITALRLAGGEGCVRLLAHDVTRGAMLLERLGRCLHELALPIGRRHEILCSLAQRIWRPAPDSGLPTGADKGRWLAKFIPARWEQLDRPCAARTVDHALACADRRITAHDDERAVLVHGDVHHRRGAATIRTEPHHAAQHAMESPLPVPSQPADPRLRRGTVGRLRGVQGGHVSCAGGRHRPWLAALALALSTVVSTLFPSTSMVWPGSQSLSAGVAVNAAVNVHNRGSSDYSEYLISAGHSHGPPTAVNVQFCHEQTYYVLAGNTPVLVHNCGVTPNNSPGTLADEIAAANRAGVSPLRAGTAEFQDAVNGGGRYIWSVSEDGTLSIAPWHPDIKRPILNGGAPVRGAGEVVFDRGMVSNINNATGHYTPSCACGGDLQAGVDAFMQVGIPVPRRAITPFGW